MTPPRSATAILLFTRSAGEEAVHKRFISHGRPADNAAVAAQLIGRATRVAQQAGVDFAHVGSAAQVGHTFGQRLAAALAHHFALGYAQLIVIGNDCPQLSAALVAQAVAALHSADAVLGPATDGGVYLLGLKRAFFQASAWQALPWQTTRLGTALASHLRRVGARLLRLRPLADVDSEQDLARLVPQLPTGMLRTRLRRLRAAGRPTRPQLPPLARPVAPAGPRPQRGPPAH